MSVSMKSLQGRAPSSEMGEQLFTEVAMFRGKPVAVRKIRKSCIGLTKDDLREMNMVGWFGIVWFKVEFWKLMFSLICTESTVEQTMQTSVISDAIALIVTPL